MFVIICDLLRVTIEDTGKTIGVPPRDGRVLNVILRRAYTRYSPLTLFSRPSIFAPSHPIGHHCTSHSPATLDHESKRAPMKVQ